ncbi:MAG TPA: chloride channel protein, partial [Phycisphaerales bacterium]|nr:chloride channel protein [Phycisphaerales bacterium]
MADPTRPLATPAGGLPVSPSLGVTLEAAQLPTESTSVDLRLARICALALALGGVAAIAAHALMLLIAFITNLAFHHRLSVEHSSPAHHALGAGVVAVPIVGGIVVGLMARYGSKAIRGHGIPETMERILTHESRIPARLTLLKPLSAAISIGTGGPFGAEGPIIATGGALGSLIGQVLRTTPAERKTLLAAGAAAGMAATFGSPVAAVLLAVELLLFEFRPRSLIPVALATTAAAGARIALEGAGPAFPMPDLAPPSGWALGVYIAIGAIMGLASVAVTRIVYGIEDLFEKLPIHWMWWPAIGCVAVGLCGYAAPRTLGVGYDVITDLLSAKLTVGAVAFLCSLKFVSWSISLGSGTSGGTLAPLFTIGGAGGLLLGQAGAQALPFTGIDVRIAALVGMAAMFAGASRALLASVVFAFETTLQPLGLLPLLGACAASYFVSALCMRQSIMTERIARRGVRVPHEYAADVLDQLWVSDVAAKDVVTLPADQPLAIARDWISSRAPGSEHTGFPLVTPEGHLAGVITRRDLLAPEKADTLLLRELVRRPPVVVYEDLTLHDAVNHMVNHDVGRLPVVARSDRRIVGIITRSNILAAYRRRLDETRPAAPSISIDSLRHRAR